MTLFPIGLLVLALLTFVVGVAEGSTALDYLSIIASGVAFVLVLVLGRFGQTRRRAAAQLAEGAPRSKRAPRARRAAAPDLFAGYEQLKTDDSFLANGAMDDDDRPDRLAESPVPTSAFGVGEIRLQATSGTRMEPYDPGLSASSPLARILQGSVPREPEPFSGPPTEAVATVSAPRPRPRIFDREIDEPSLGMPAEAPEPVPDSVADPDEDYFVDEPMFPIADYDDLRIDEIVPLLPELEADEIDVVRAREQAGANRGFILRRLDILEARLNENEAGRTASQPAPPPAPPAATYGPPPAEPAAAPPERPVGPTAISTPSRTYSPPRRTYGPPTPTYGPTPAPPPQSVPPPERPAPGRRFAPSPTPPAPSATPSAPGRRFAPAPPPPTPPAAAPVGPDPAPALPYAPAAYRPPASRPAAPPPPVPPEPVVSRPPSALPIPAVQPRTYGTPSAPAGPAFSEVGYIPLPNREAIVQAEPGNLQLLPIEEYDQLRVIDILAALSDLDADEVERIRRYEVSGACRAPILRQIELLSSLGAPPSPASEPTSAPAQRRAPRSWGSRD